MEQEDRAKICEIQRQEEAKKIQPLTFKVPTHVKFPISNY